MDAVSKVLNRASSDIEDTPDSGAKPAMPFIVGIAKLYGKVKSLLDIDRVNETSKRSTVSKASGRYPNGRRGTKAIKVSTLGQHSILGHTFFAVHKSKLPCVRGSARTGRPFG